MTPTEAAIARRERILAEQYAPPPQPWPTPQTNLVKLLEQLVELVADVMLEHDRHHAAGRVS